MANIEGPKNDTDGLNLKDELSRPVSSSQKEEAKQEESLDTNQRLSMSNFPQKTVKVGEKLERLNFHVVDKKGQKIDCSFDLTQQGCILVVGGKRFPIIEQGYNIKEIGFQDKTDSNPGNLVIKGNMFGLLSYTKNFLGVIDKILASDK